MPDEIRIGRQTRVVPTTQVTIDKRSTGGSSLSFSLSSEQPVDRSYGTEILSHDKSAVRLSRAESGAMPLLFNHNWDDPIGMVDVANVDGKRLMVNAHFFETSRGKEVASMVDGGLRNVSVGYQVHAFSEDSKSRTYKAVDWEPLEASIVTVPADHTVGIGRSSDSDVVSVPVIRSKDFSGFQPAAPAAQQGGPLMDTSNNAAAGAVADEVVERNFAQPKQGPTAAEMDAARVRAINHFAKANTIPNDVREMWIAQGTPLEKVGEDILAIQRNRGEGDPKPASALGLTDKEKREFSIARMILAVRDKDYGRVGFEIECSREISKKLGQVPDPNKFYVPFDVQQRSVEVQKRDLTAAAAGAGGYLVGTQNVGFIDLLRNRSVAMRMGAVRLSGLTGNITVPRQSAAATAVWLANESSTITESQQTFVQMALAPKNVGAYTEISRQLLMQSNPAAEAIVTTDLAAQVSLAADLAALSGSGASGQPTGITNTAGIGTVAGAGFLAAAFARILAFQTGVAAANVMPARGGYVTTPVIAAAMIAAVKYASTASPVWEGNVWDGSMQGFPAMTSNQMAAASMIFGDWSQLVMAEWGTLEIEVNPYANFQAGIIGVRAIYSMDVGVRIPAAFALATSIA